MTNAGCNDWECDRGGICSDLNVSIQNSVYRVNRMGNSYPQRPDDDKSTVARGRLQTRMRRSEQLACCCLRSSRNREE